MKGVCLEETSPLYLDHDRIKRMQPVISMRFHPSVTQIFSSSQAARDCCSIYTIAERSAPSPSTRNQLDHHLEPSFTPITNGT